MHKQYINVTIIILGDIFAIEIKRKKKKIIKKKKKKKKNNNA
jgi:predicted Zn-dependent peptidase